MDATATRIDMCSGWEFRKGRTSPAWLSEASGSGERVDLPHCWNAQDTYHKGTDYYRGWGAYRREFTTPDSAGAICLFETEGFYGIGDVWLNGRRVALVDGEYIGVSVDLTAHLAPLGQANVLAVRLTNRCPKHVLPGIADPDFVLHGGLSGRAWLRLRPHLHIVDGATRLTCPDPLADTAMLTITSAVRNDGPSLRTVQLRWELLDAAGSGVASAEAVRIVLEGGQGKVVAATLTVSSPAPWSLDSPVLYRLVSTLTDDEVTVDTREMDYGLRRAEFRAHDGFYLNGDRVPLRGCNRHESMPGFGRALPSGLHALDARTIKDHGLNFVRLSHYPQHPGFLQACDRLGLLVYAELASWKSVRGHGRWLQSATRQFEHMIRRDRHHPSIILWGMGNEAQSRRAYLKLRRIAGELDPGRPVTYAENHFYRARRARTLGVPDVWGVNYELDAIRDGLAASRMQCVVVSECSNEPHTCRGDLAAELRQVRTLERDLSRLDDRAGVAGWTVWCYNDYATLRKGRYRRFSGIVDAWRVPKLAATWLKFRYGNEPCVRIAGDWGREGSATRTIAVVGNGGAVRLACGGKTLAEVQADGFAEVELPYTPDPLVAETERDGRRVSDTLWPFGDAWGLVLDLIPPCHPERSVAESKDLETAENAQPDRGPRFPSTPHFAPDDTPFIPRLSGKGLPADHADRRRSFCQFICAHPRDLRANPCRRGRCHAHEPTGYARDAPQDDRGDWSAVTVRVVDADGHVVTTWQGDVALSVTGAACVHTLRPDGCVPVAGGCARAYLTAGCAGFTVRAEAAGLQSATLEVGAAASADDAGEVAP